MKAMIFAAGLGTRFKPWTDNHPKALAMVNGKCLLQRNIEYLQQYGITDVVVNVHHFADQIIDTVQVNKGWGSKVVISDETNEVLETGGGLLKARPLLEGNESFVTLNVDILLTWILMPCLTFIGSTNPWYLLVLPTDQLPDIFYLTQIRDFVDGGMQQQAKKKWLSLNRA